MEPVRGTICRTQHKRRVQVKSRRYGPGSNPTHFGDISNFEKEGFDDFVGVLFEADFTVRCAYLATYDWVSKNGTRVQGKQRVNIGSFLAAANADELEKLNSTRASRPWRNSARRVADMSSDVRPALLFAFALRQKEQRRRETYPRNKGSLAELLDVLHRS